MAMLGRMVLWGAMCVVCVMGMSFASTGEDLETAEEKRLFEKKGDDDIPLNWRIFAKRRIEPYKVRLGKRNFFGRNDKIKDREAVLLALLGGPQDKRDKVEVKRPKENEDFWQQMAV